MKNSYLYSALVAAVSISVANAENSTPPSDHERCYGIAKAGENECWGTDKKGEYHSCYSWSEVDNDPYAWMYVPKGECLKKGGSLHPPPVPVKKPQAQES